MEIILPKTVFLSFCIVTYIFEKISPKMINLLLGTILKLTEQWMAAYWARAAAEKEYQHGEKVCKYFLILNSLSLYPV